MRELQYLINQRCNERCTKCESWKFDSTTIGSKDFLKFANKNKWYTLAITGGEPLLEKQEVIEIINGYTGGHITIWTNATLFDEEFLNECKDKDICLAVSLDTLDPIRWKEIKGTNSLDKVLKNLDLAYSILDPKQIQISPVDYGRNDLHDVEAYAVEHGSPYVTQPYIDFGYVGKEGDDTGASQCYAGVHTISVKYDRTVSMCFNKGIMGDNGGLTIDEESFDLDAIEKNQDLIDDFSINCNKACSKILCYKKELIKDLRENSLKSR